MEFIRNFTNIKSHLGLLQGGKGAGGSGGQECRSGIEQERQVGQERELKATKY